jgi:uncharacterized protein YwgA
MMYEISVPNSWNERELVMLDDFARYALVARMVKALQSAGSWCGRTHIQKSLFFVQSLFLVEQEFEYVMYQHGPYSFQLDEDIVQLRRLNGLDLQVAPAPYGPHYTLTSGGENLLERFRLETSGYHDPIEFVAREFGKRSVRQLELLATSAFVEGSNQLSDLDLVRDIAALKPHFSEPEILNAIQEIRTLRSAAAAMATAL